MPRARNVGHCAIGEPHLGTLAQNRLQPEDVGDADVRNQDEHVGVSHGGVSLRTQRNPHRSWQEAQVDHEVVVDLEVERPDQEDKLILAQHAEEQSHSQRCQEVSRGESR